MWFKTFLEISVALNGLDIKFQVNIFCQYKCWLVNASIFWWVTCADISGQQVVEWIILNEWSVDFIKRDYYIGKERAWQQHFMKQMLPFSCWDWKIKNKKITPKSERENNLPLHILEAEIYSFEHIQIGCSLMFKESCFKGKYPCKLYIELVMTAVILLIFRVWLRCQTEVWVPIKIQKTP